eukprot:gene10167-biopygen3274
MAGFEWIIHLRFTCGSFASHLLFTCGALAVHVRFILRSTCGSSVVHLRFTCVHAARRKQESCTRHPNNAHLPLKIWVMNNHDNFAHAVAARGHWEGDYGQGRSWKDIGWTPAWNETHTASTLNRHFTQPQHLKKRSSKGREGCKGANDTHLRMRPANDTHLWFTNATHCGQQLELQSANGAQWRPAFAMHLRLANHTHLQPANGVQSRPANSTHLRSQCSAAPRGAARRGTAPRGAARRNAAWCGAAQCSTAPQAPQK